MLLLKLLVTLIHFVGLSLQRCVVVHVQLLLVKVVIIGMIRALGGVSGSEK